MGKGSSFERGDGVAERTGGGAALSGTAFDVDDDDVLGCGDTCGGAGEGFDRPFNESLLEYMY